MNDYQTNLWNDLMILVDDSETFYYADRKMDDNWYRLFNYRLANYTEFLKPNALECRGHMFLITEEGEEAEVISLVALPPQKFFNLYENPSTMDLDLTQVDLIMDKMDGSLISTYSHIPWFSSQPAKILKLKTKGSLESDQAIAAMAWLNQPENHMFRDELATADRAGWTVNLEWLSPTNRIVIGYMTPHLKVLNVRSRMDGTYINSEDVDAFVFPEILKHWVYEYMFDDPITFVEAIPNMTENIEGFVCRLVDGTYFKCKTDQYVHLHRNKDSVNSPKKLFGAVVYETTDDLRSLFSDDQPVLDKIQEMENHVSEHYNHVVSVVENFFKTNHLLNRKEYAILGQKELQSGLFSLGMSLYLGREVDYKAFMVKQYDNYKLPGSIEP